MASMDNQHSALQSQLGQALTTCGNPSDVLRLLEEFQRMSNSGNLPTAMHRTASSGGGGGSLSSSNMATAMHRIASTGSQEASDREKVIRDQRFQLLVVNVEHRLKQAPETFGEQHLANVVWGAAKLRLQREPLFEFVQREVLSRKNQLDKFSPQQLAAIAWSYAMVKYHAPELFVVVQDEAARKPPLAEMLKKAGLLQDRPQTPSNFGMVGAVGARSNTPSMQHSIGGGMTHQLRDVRDAPLPPHLQPIGGSINNNGGNGMPYQAKHASAGGGLMQQRAQQSAQQAYGAQGGGGGGAPPMLKGGAPAGYGQQQHGLQQQMPPAGYHQQYGASGGHGQGERDACVRSQDVSKVSDVARAAEEHKKEMEDKQRQAIGCDPEGGELCPLCVELMDPTDLALIPCPCGYQICLLCLNKIQNEGNRQCPACRSEYEEDKFRKVDLPPRKKKGSDESAAGDAGWETGAKKGKGATNKMAYANKKPPVPLTFPGFSPKVAEMLQQCHEAGIVTKGELDERVMEDLKILPERGAIAVLSEFMKKDMTRIRNKSAFVNGIIDRVQKELAHDKSGTAVGGGGSNHMGWQGQQQQQNSNTVTYNGPVGGMTEQRPRGLSDVDTIPRTGAGMAGMPAPIAQQQQQANKAMACRPPQAAGIIGSGMGMRGGSSAITGSLGWSGAGDDEADEIIGMRGLGLGGSGLGSETIGGAGSASLLHEDQSAEVERARQQVEQFLMSHKQKQQQQFATPGGMTHGGYQPIGGIHNMGFANAGASDASLGRLGVVSQASGTIRAAAAGGIGFGRAPGPLAGAPAIGAPLHGLESEEQARAGAEAGSRLLEYITGARGGVNGGVAGGAAVEPERRSKLPLFMRNNGAHGAAHQSLSQSLSPLSHDGDAEGWNTEIEPRALAPKASWEDEDEFIINMCFQCQRDGRGDIDQTDGHFYCNECWGAFESCSQASNPMNAVGNKQQVRGCGRGADISA